MQLRQIAFAGVSGLSLGPRRWVAIVAMLAVLPWSAWAASAEGQERKAARSDKELPAPEEVVLSTADNLQLAMTYYPGTKGKQTIPIVLLHGWKQSQNDFRNLAPSLQSHGYAVIVPDLRGHGGSTRRKDARKDDALDAAKLTATQFGQMVTQDMRAVKNFIWEKNNAGELNIDKLCLVGADMGASVALDFALNDAIDQEHNRVQRPEYKLGRFVKALVLISPKWQFPGLPLRPATAHPVVQSEISMLILVGKQDPKAMEAARRIHGVFERFHPEPTGDDKLDKQTLLLGKLDTSLQGTQLLDPKFRIPDIIGDFINRRLVKSDEAKEWTWQERKPPP